MAIFQVPYSTGELKVSLPDSDDINVLVPKIDDVAATEEEVKVIETALDNPIEKAPLETLVSSASKVSIIVDDATRPTPTKMILPLLLKRLYAANVKKENITIVFALGSHRSLTAEEQIMLLGHDIWRDYRVVQHDCRDEKNLRTVSDPAGQTVMKVNKWVAEADLKILTGFIKPHRIAGYNGGAKSILPGVADLDTIISNHSYANLSHPMCGIGIADGNPARRQMEEKARHLEPLFIINVVLDLEKNVIGAFAGDLVRAHRKGVELVDSLAKIEVESQADVVIACCPYPTDANLYQATYGATVAFKTKRPILRKGGVIILVADCPEGIGTEDFGQLISHHRDPQELLDVISKPGFAQVGQWAGQDWGELLTYASLIIVSHGGIPKDFYERNPVDHAESVEEAWEQARTLLGKERIRGYILPQAPYSIPVVSSEYKL